MAKKSKDAVQSFFAQIGLPQEGELLSRCAHWVTYHRRQFGKTILDVSENGGVTACFLAQQMPFAQVTALARDPEQAAALAEQLGLNNIRFVRERLEQRAFETVVSVDTFRARETGERVDPTLLLGGQAARYASQVGEYITRLSALLAPGGCLISLEPMPRRARFLGWLYAMGEAGLTPVRQYQKELQFQNAQGEKAPLQVTVATKGASPDREELFRLFAEPYQEMIRRRSFVLSGFDAEVYLQSEVGELIEGYVVYFRAGGKATKIALWTDKDDPTALLCEQHTAGSGNKLFRSLMEKKREEIGVTHKDINNFLSQGMRVKLLRYIDGEEVEVDLPENPEDI